MLRRSHSRSVSNPVLLQMLVPCVDRLRGTSRLQARRWKVLVVSTPNNLLFKANRLQVTACHYVMGCKLPIMTLKVDGYFAHCGDYQVLLAVQLSCVYSILYL